MNAFLDQCISVRSVIVSYGQFSWRVSSQRNGLKGIELNLDMDCLALSMFMCSSVSALISSFLNCLIVFMARTASAAKVSSKIYRLSCRYFHRGFWCAWPITTAQFPSDTSEQNGAPSREQRSVRRHNIPVPPFHKHTCWTTRVSSFHSADRVTVGQVAGGSVCTVTDLLCVKEGRVGSSCRDGGQQVRDTWTLWVAPTVRALDVLG